MIVFRYSWIEKTCPRKSKFSRAVPEMRKTGRTSCAAAVEWKNRNLLMLWKVVSFHAVNRITNKLFSVIFGHIPMYIQTINKQARFVKIACDSEV